MDKVDCNKNCYSTAVFRDECTSIPVKVSEGWVERQAGLGVQASASPSRQTVTGQPENGQPGNVTDSSSLEGYKP